jgi:hypothetical protein
VFSLSSSDFSIPLPLFYNSESVYFCRTGFVASEQLKFKYFAVIFSPLYNMSLFL